MKKMINIAKLFFSTEYEDSLNSPISRDEFDAKMILYSKCYLVIAVVVLVAAFLQVLR